MPVSPPWWPSITDIQVTRQICKMHSARWTWSLQRMDITSIPNFRKWTSQHPCRPWTPTQQRCTHLFGRVVELVLCLRHGNDESWSQMAMFVAVLPNLFHNTCYLSTFAKYKRGEKERIKDLNRVGLSFWRNKECWEESFLFFDTHTKERERAIVNCAWLFRHKWCRQYNNPSRVWPGRVSEIGTSAFGQNNVSGAETEAKKSYLVLKWSRSSREFCYLFQSR